MEEFEVLYEGAFPNVIGCIGGAHISMSPPKNDKAAYINKKQFTSVLLQAVCDAKLRFTNIFAGWPGSSQVASIWGHSPLCEQIQQNPELISDSAHIIGDIDYPLSTYLMTPYKDDGQLTTKQLLFNDTLRSTRMVIDQAFAKLFGRFRRLKHLLMFKMERMPIVIIAGCVLHNLCIVEDDGMPDVESNDDDVNGWVFGDSDQAEGVQTTLLQDAIVKRDSIADGLFDAVKEC